jgi:hypothetical protein
MRVLLGKWNTMLRLPKKDPIPSSVDAYASTYEASKVSVSAGMEPCLPLRSPTWHVSGASLLQGVASPRM